MSVTDLRALRDKYERMLRLRELHARVAAEPGFVEPDPRPEMVALSRSYPGALREIDELPLELIRARIEELAAAESGAASVAPWMTAQTRFHALARGALAVKRWLAGRALTAELEEAFTAALPTLPHADEAQAWSADLAAIATPPRGRLMDLVHARLARELGVDVAAARTAVLPPCASLRGRGA